MRFDELRRNYPTKSRPELYADMGPEWVARINDPNYVNTCAIRLSLTLAAVGMPIPRDRREAMSRDGTHLILKVASMKRHLIATIGESYWQMSKQPGTPVGSGDLPRASGIIVYHANWSDATGHFDLWTGTGFVGSGNFESITDGFALELWKID